MRVLMVNQYYPPDVSATAYLLGELSEDLARNHDVWVVAGKPSYNPEGSTFQPAGVELRRTWSTTFSRGGMFGRVLNYATFVMTSLARTLRVPRPDVVVAMTDPPVIGLIGLLAARRHRCPFVYVCEDIFPDVGIALKRADNPAVVWLWRRLNHLLRRRATKLVAIGRDMAEKLSREGVPPDRIAYLPNWANAPPVTNDEVKRIRRSFGWEDRYVVMHAGNQGLAQNLGTVIEAAELLQDRREILFVFVGDGAARPGLERAATERALSNVVFLPYRPKDQAQATLAAADVHVITLAPGLWGCVVPSKVYGVLALGLPFVAGVDRDSEVYRIVQETGAGISVEPGDAAGMAKAIAELASNERDAATAGRAGRAEFERNYERSLATARYDRLLREIAGATGGSPP